MEQVALNVTALGQFSPWLPLDYYAEPFNASLAVYYGSGLAATFTVQLAIDDVSRSAQRPVLISQSGTTITVTDPGPPAGPIAGTPAGGWGHGLATGDYCNILEASPGSVGAVVGEYPTVTVVNATTYTIVSPFTQTIVGETGVVVTARVTPHATLTAVTTRAVGNQGFPAYAARLNSTAFSTGGIAFLFAMQGGRSS
jgi:hypothetical protein